MMKLFRVEVATFVFVGNLICMAPAYAYLDPGTGSILLQGLLAGIAGAAVVIKLYWARLKGFFSSTSSSEGSDDDRSKSENSDPQD